MIYFKIFVPVAHCLHIHALNTKIYEIKDIKDTSEKRSAKSVRYTKNVFIEGDILTKKIAKKTP